MKNKIFTILALLAIIYGCSSDDDKKVVAKCDCQKITATYDAASQTYDPISTEFYSNNCDDEKLQFNTDNNGKFYRINCTPREQAIINSYSDLTKKLLSDK